MVKKPSEHVLFINRCPAGLDGEKWLDEKTKTIEANEEKMKKIWICSPTLGFVYSSF
jgi:hypothetical protein